MRPFNPHTMLLSLVLAATIACTAYAADPTCSTGMQKGNVCCPRSCAVCGGPLCGRGGQGASCCVTRVRDSGRMCNDVNPPCVIASSPSTNPPTTKPPTTNPPSTTASGSDPSCTTGIRKGNVCCARSCNVCGGPLCGRGGQGDSCCLTRIRNSGRSCSQVSPPCVVGQNSPTTAPPTTTKPSTTTVPPTTSPPSRGGSGVWKTVPSLGSFTKRHESCFVMVNGKAYLVGGRRDKNVEMFNPMTGVWTSGPKPPIQLHHGQCVVWDNKIWLVSPWTGSFPSETTVSSVYYYDTVTNSWGTRQGLPANRQRGAAAAVLVGSGVYVVGGNRGGHGPQSTVLGWMDYYDLQADKWTTNLPDLPDERDHTGGALIGDDLCIASGRHGNYSWVGNKQRVSTWCYNIKQGFSGSWRNMNAPLPQGRSGSAIAALCDGRMMVAGGEAVDAFSTVNIFDGSKWTTTGSMNVKRHGTGLAVSACSCGKVFIAAGAMTRGGSSEISDPRTFAEVYIPGGVDYSCSSF